MTAGTVTDAVEAVLEDDLIDEERESMGEKEKQYRLSAYVMTVTTLLFVVLEFMLHRKVVFMMDDFWYATNLATGNPLATAWDVIQSQVWHYMNWGGRSITHGLLQFTLMGGELFADILNILMTVTLSWLLCVLAGAKNWRSFCTAFILLISLNGDVKLSMFWQSGSANYLYSTGWILLFVLIDMRQVKDPDAKPLKGVCAWIIPLALISGWSNENMGPASFCLSLIVIGYFAAFLKKKVPVWMWLGSAFSLLGSILVVVAPGNFVRSAFVEEAPLWKIVYERCLTMLSAGTEVLFPTVLFLLIFLGLYLKAGNPLQPFQIMLLTMAVLAFGAMILSPTFPERATFGIMAIGIVLILSFIEGMIKSDSGYKKYAFIFYIWMFAFGLYVLTMELRLPLEL